MLKRLLLCVFSLIFVVTVGYAQDDTPTSPVFFDDFSYTGTDDETFIERGWIVREGEGWPGVPSAIWWAEGVEVVDDTESEGNRLMQMTSQTDGETTYQSQFCYQRKFRVGTYAARVRFSDAPQAVDDESDAPDGDEIVQTFYTIAPLEFELDPNYSEMDFEYLPNGGWGYNDNVFFATTWETFRPDPNWLAVNESGTLDGSYEGWRTLVIQAVDGEVIYYVDDELLSESGGRYFPEVPMSINFNLWFVNGGLTDSDVPRQYVEQIDWVYHAADVMLTPEEVTAQVEAMRADDVAYIDTVIAEDELVSPCDF